MPRPDQKRPKQGRPYSRGTKDPRYSVFEEQGGLQIPTSQPKRDVFINPSANTVDAPAQYSFGNMTPGPSGELEVLSALAGGISKGADAYNKVYNKRIKDYEKKVQAEKDYADGFRTVKFAGSSDTNQETTVHINDADYGMYEQMVEDGMAFISNDETRRYTYLRDKIETLNKGAPVEAVGLGTRTLQAYSDKSFAADQRDRASKMRQDLLTMQDPAERLEYLENYQNSNPVFRGTVVGDLWHTEHADNAQKVDRVNFNVAAREFRNSLEQVILEAEDNGTLFKLDFPKIVADLIETQGLFPDEGPQSLRMIEELDAAQAKFNTKLNAARREQNETTRRLHLELEDQEWGGMSLADKIKGFPERVKSERERLTEDVATNTPENLQLGVRTFIVNEMKAIMEGVDTVGPAGQEALAKLINGIRGLLGDELPTDIESILTRFAQVITGQLGSEIVNEDVGTIRQRELAKRVEERNEVLAKINLTGIATEDDREDLEVMEAEITRIEKDDDYVLQLGKNLTEDALIEQIMGPFEANEDNIRANYNALTLDGYTEQLEHAARGAVSRGETSSLENLSVFTGYNLNRHEPHIAKHMRNEDVIEIAVAALEYPVNSKEREAAFKELKAKGVQFPPKFMQVISGVNDKFQQEVSRVQAAEDRAANAEAKASENAVKADAARRDYTFDGKITPSGEGTAAGKREAAVEVSYYLLERGLSSLLSDPVSAEAMPFLGQYGRDLENLRQGAKDAEGNPLMTAERFEEKYGPGEGNWLEGIEDPEVKEDAVRLFGGNYADTGFPRLDEMKSSEGIIAFSQIAASIVTENHGARTNLGNGIKVEISDELVGNLKEDIGILVDNIAADSLKGTEFGQLARLTTVVSNMTGVGFVARGIKDINFQRKRRNEPHLSGELLARERERLQTEWNNNGWMRDGDTTTDVATVLGFDQELRAFMHMTGPMLNSGDIRDLQDPDSDLGRLLRAGLYGLTDGQDLDSTGQSSIRTVIESTDYETNLERVYALFAELAGGVGSVEDMDPQYIEDINAFLMARIPVVAERKYKESAPDLGADDDDTRLVDPERDLEEAAKDMLQSFLSPTSLGRLGYVRRIYSTPNLPKNLRPNVSTVFGYATAPVNTPDGKRIDGPDGVSFIQGNLGEHMTFTGPLGSRSVTLAAGPQLQGLQFDPRVVPATVDNLQYRTNEDLDRAQELTRSLLNDPALDEVRQVIFDGGAVTGTIFLDGMLLANGIQGEGIGDLINSFQPRPDGTNYDNEQLAAIMGDLNKQYTLSDGSTITLPDPIKMMELLGTGLNVLDIKLSVDDVSRDLSGRVDMDGTYSVGFTGANINKIDVAVPTSLQRRNTVRGEGGNETVLDTTEEITMNKNSPELNLALMVAEAEQMGVAPEDIPNLFYNPQTGLRDRAVRKLSQLNIEQLEDLRKRELISLAHSVHSSLQTVEGGIGMMEDGTRASPAYLVSAATDLHKLRLLTIEHAMYLVSATDMRTDPRRGGAEAGRYLDSGIYELGRPQAEVFRPRATETFFGTEGFSRSRLTEVYTPTIYDVRIMEGFKNNAGVLEFNPDEPPRTIARTASELLPVGSRLAGDIVTAGEDFLRGLGSTVYGPTVRNIFRKTEDDIEGAQTYIGVGRGYQVRIAKGAPSQKVTGEFTIPGISLVPGEETIMLRDLMRLIHRESEY